MFKIIANPGNSQDTFTVGNLSTHNSSKIVLNRYF